MIAFIFPGQGSQRRGMGQQLFDAVREYTAVERQVDELLGYSLRKLCLEDPDNRLKETQYTQPALYVVNALYYYKALNEGTKADYLAGHSLGEYNGLLAAGVFDFMTGLRLVQRRGALMALAKHGGMAAVMGLHESKINALLRDNGFASMDIANINAPSQIVISGPLEDIRRAGPIFESAGAKMYMPLQVSAAFHSRYLADAARQFESFLAPMSFMPPARLVIANVNAEPYPTANASQAVKDRLVQQITHPVRWVESVRYLLARGVTDFRELGPGGVLARLVQQIQDERGRG